MPKGVPLVSVISAWYDRPEELEASVRSVLDQQGVALEYIVVDDASSDARTVRRLTALDDTRLRLVRNAANMGFTRSMRRAAAMARGTFVAVHDAGDISRPGRLAAQAAFLQAHPDHAAVGCAVENHNLATGDRRVQHVVPQPRKPGYTHGEVMFRRDFYEAAGGYRELFYYAQDGDLWYRLAERGALGTLDEVLYERRVFPGGVEGDPVKMMRQTLFSTLGGLARDARRRGVPDPVARRGALALLEMPPTRRFLTRARGRTGDLLKRRRWAEARRALDGLPLGQMSVVMAGLHLGLCAVAPAGRRAGAPDGPLARLGHAAPARAAAPCSASDGSAPRPRVSVISAWYDRPEELEASVRSVLDQQGVELEYIVVDDASRDAETARRLAALEDPRLRLVRNDVNMGFTRSIRRAAAMATGPFIAVHDAGDISRPGRLAAQAAFLQAHPDHAAVGCGVENRDMATGVVTLYQGEGAPGRPHAPYTHGEVMFRRDLYKAVGGYRELFYYAQDNDLWYRLAERGALGMLDEVLYERRVFPDGIAGNLGRSVAQAVFGNLGIVAAEARLAGEPDPVARRGALALLEQPPTPWFEGRASWRLKRMVRAGHWREARTAMDRIPAGMTTAKMRLLYLALRVVAPRCPGGRA